MKFNGKIFIKCENYSKFRNFLRYYKDSDLNINFYETSSFGYKIKYSTSNKNIAEEISKYNDR